MAQARRQQVEIPTVPDNERWREERQMGEVDDNGSPKWDVFHDVIEQ